MSLLIGGIRTAPFRSDRLLSTHHLVVMERSFFAGAGTAIQAFFVSPLIVGLQALSILGLRVLIADHAITIFKGTKCYVETYLGICSPTDRLMPKLRSSEPASTAQIWTKCSVTPHRELGATPVVVRESNFVR